ncbi:glycosyl hydrolase catalytic core-domain-containing protein [Mycena olivaceomarginata]|nr:glycosyl hydrolase catalytic core-domain-containing protein [Mycena olivaceomarginata]
MRPGTLSFFATVGVVTANVVRHLGRVVTKTLPAGWFYLGCKVDVGNRILVAANQVSTTNTPQTCIAFCSSQGLAMAGVKFSCSSACTGDSAQTWGGASRIQVYQASAGATTTSTTAKATPTASGRRGLARPGDNNFDPSILKSGKNWDHSNTPKNTVFPFYAMQWNAAGISTLEADARAAGEHDAGVCCCPWSVYKQWSYPLSAKGFKLATPVVTNGGAPVGLTWFDSFLAACSGCAFDYIALHWHDGWIDDFTEFIDEAKKYNKPIYLTEFGLAWDAIKLLGVPPPRFDELAVAKYAFFCAFHSGTGKEMIAADGTLTDLGKIYVS